MGTGGRPSTVTRLPEGTLWQGCVTADAGPERCQTPLGRWSRGAGPGDGGWWGGVVARRADHYLITHVTLRVALAGVALAILAAFVVDRTQRSCWLTSLSASWYTDARPVFVGGLVAIGVALVAYSGSTWTENLLLDLAGVLAPVVAFAPTRSTCRRTPRAWACPSGVVRHVSAADLALLVYLGALVLGTGATFLASAAVRAELAPCVPPAPGAEGRAGARGGPGRRAGGVAPARPSVRRARALPGGGPDVRAADRRGRGPHRSGVAADRPVGPLPRPAERAGRRVGSGSPTSASTPSSSRW